MDEAQKFKGGDLYVGSSQVKSGHLAVSGCGPVQSPLWLKRGVKVEVSQFILQWSNKNGVEWGGAGRVWGLMAM